MSTTVQTETTKVLVTGGNRGIGKALVAAYLARPHHLVIAAVRSPDHPSVQSIRELPVGEGSELVVVKIESSPSASSASDSSDAEDAIEYLRSTRHISSLDLVIANAGIAKLYPFVHEAKTADMLEHFLVNAVGTVDLWKAVRPLLTTTTQQGGNRKPPKFVAISSSAGTIGAMEALPFPNAVYGTSKAALNYVVKKIHVENEGVVAFPICPGWVQTDMGNGGAELLGFERPEITVEESVSGLVKVIDQATREDTSGKFWTHKGALMSW